MIGAKAIEFMVFPLFGVVLLTILFVTAVRRSTHWSLGKRLGAIVLSVAAGAYVLSGIVFHVSDYSRVRAFRPEDLTEVHIGSHVLTSPRDLDAICSTLRTTQWFESRHGGWEEELPLVFKTTTGHEYSYRVAYYRVHPGAVILRRIGGNDTFMLGDVGFNSGLPEVLTRLGIPLPEGKQ